jgi:long-chain acyl-CoA synthetase
MGFVKYALGQYGQSLVSLAAQDYFFKGRWRKTYFEQLTNLAPFDRRSGLRHGLRQAAEPILQGKTVLLFPEGTRSVDGTIHEFKPTLGHLALNCKVDILPIYLGGTYEALPKGSSLPKKREISARIGPPLTVADLERLTEGMKPAVACRTVAKLAREAVVALQRGGILDLSEYETAIEALGEKREHPLVALFRELSSRYVEGSVEKTVTYYFSLGQESEAKWTAVLAPDSCHIQPGKPVGAPADCVLKTNPDIFIKMIRESYMPTPMEIMSGMVKSNDVSLLATFQEAFDLR